jgi:hypothetical protein
MLVGASEALQPRAALGSGGAAPEREALGELFFCAGQRESRQQRGATSEGLGALSAERVGAFAGRRKSREQCGAAGVGA